MVLSNAIARQPQSTSVFQLAYRKSVRMVEKCRQETERFHCPRGRYRHVSGDDSSPCLRDCHADSWPLCPKLVAMIDIDPKTLRKMKSQTNHRITGSWTHLRQRLAHSLVQYCYVPGFHTDMCHQYWNEKHDNTADIITACLWRCSHLSKRRQYQTHMSLSHI